METHVHKIVGSSNQYEQAKCSCGEWMDYQNVEEHLAVENAKQVAPQDMDVLNFEQEWTKL